MGQTYLWNALMPIPPVKIWLDNSLIFLGSLFKCRLINALFLKHLEKAQQPLSLLALPLALILPDLYSMVLNTNQHMTYLLTVCCFLQVVSLRSADILFCFLMMYLQDLEQYLA